MANYTAADIKALREQTGAGMMDVKKALDEANGDTAKAIEIIRVKGLKGATKRESRATAEGLVAATVVDGKTGYMIELNCETDFVAKNEKFIAVANTTLAAAVEAGAADVDSVLAAPAEGKTVKDVIDELGAILGEKLQLRRVSKVEGDTVDAYLHKTSKDLPAQVGVLVAVTGDNAEVAHDVAVHVAAMSPTYLNRDAVPEEKVADERRIADETARAEGKPEAALAKIVEGRLTGFFKDVVLVDQAFAKDAKKSVGKVLEEAGATATAFERFRVGA